MHTLNKAEIEQVFDMDIAVAAIRDAYVAQAQGRVQAPPVTYLGFETANGDCHVKAGHIAGSEAFVIKVAMGFYDNPAKGLPSSNGMNLVFDATTGQTRASLQDEGWLTDMRTGIGGALATQALAQPGFTKVLIVGAGLQCLFQARALQHVMPDTALDFCVWGRDAAKARAATDALLAEGIAANTATDLAAAAQEAQVIICATPAKSPLIRSAWISPGTHITAIGADTPGKQELDSDLVAQANLRVCDLAAQSLEHGEFQTAHAAKLISKDDVVALGDVLSGAHPGRASASDITIADLTGLAAQDAAISLAILRSLHTQKDPS